LGEVDREVRRGWAGAGAIAGVHQDLSHFT